MYGGDSRLYVSRDPNQMRSIGSLFADEERGSRLSRENYKAESINEMRISLNVMALSFARVYTRVTG